MNKEIDYSQITSAVLHEPALGPLGYTGGAGEEAAKTAQRLHEMGLLHAFITASNMGNGLGGESQIGQILLPDKIHFLDRPSSLDEVLADQRLWEPIVDKLQRISDGSRRYDLHYYYTGGLFLKVMASYSQHDAKGLYMGHTWQLSVNHNNFGRHTSDTRHATEMDILADPQVYIGIQTEAELKDIKRLYAGDNIDLAHFIEQKSAILPLGIDEIYYAMGRLDNLRRVIESRKAQQQLVNKLLYYKSPFADHMKSEGGKLKRNFTSDPVVCMSIGRLAVGKGHIEAVNAFAEARKMDPAFNAVLIIAGGLKDNEYTHNLIKARNGFNPETQDRVAIIGAHPDVEVLRTGLNNGLFIGGSARESFHLAAVKAGAVGLPLVVTDDPIRQEIFDGGRTPESGVGFADCSNIHELAMLILRYSTPEAMQNAHHYNPKAMSIYTEENAIKKRIDAMIRFGMLPDSYKMDDRI